MFPDRNRLIVLLFSVVFAANAIVPAASGANSSRAKPMKFVGTYFAESGRLICTYNADGTVFLVSADMFTEDVNAPTAARKTTPWQGGWRKVGNNQIQVTLWSFATEPFGHNYNANGVIFRTKWLATFDEAVKGGKVKCPTVDGPVMLTLKPGANGGTVMRLTGKGWTKKGWRRFIG